MTFIDADALPSLEEAFEKLGYGNLVKVLADAGIMSMATLLALPPETLSLQGITSTHASLIDMALRGNNLERRRSDEDLLTYVKRQYGQIEDAPIGVLQIAVVRIGTEDTSILAPLETVRYLEKAHGFYRSIRGLRELEYEELVNAAEMFEWEIDNLDKDLFAIRIRLMDLELDFGASTTPDTHK